MADLNAVEVIWNRETRPAGTMKFRDGDYLINVRFFPAYVDPEPEHPVGRKGLVLASMWKALNHGGTSDGLLIKDGDVAIDPHILGQMMAAVSKDPLSVWTAPVRIWPTATGRAEWIWGHWDDHGHQGEPDEEARWFSFCFTYVPKAVLAEAMRRGLATWEYPRVDVNMSKAAQAIGVSCRTVSDCYPVHMHY